ncbi:uncharacterized protein C6orf15 homolog [Mastomys coucha]|uniref:uncharacterized protein C6orf15 homolog n=1 Tax=Mastomys coucha TaxID=35658 RepID=UPI001261589C|nr:uncharacterized protein C6orf15 homolog [Mastomys coucha]
MQSCAGGSRAPLGLLLICLCLPGLFARSTGAPEEKVSPRSRQPSFTSLLSSGQPQPKPDPVNNELLGVLPRISESSQDGALPEGPSGSPFWGAPPMESWPSEDPQQGMAAAAAAVAEDQLEQVLPEALPYLSRGDSLPEAFSAPAEAEALVRSPFWFLVPKLLPGLSGRILRPGTSWGSGGAGTGWGIRPMPYPSGIWGSNSLVSGTGLMGKVRYPVGSWGGNVRYPVGSWGGNVRYPVGSWGGNSWYPIGSWGGNGWYPGGSWGGNVRYPVGSWGGNARYPVGSWGGKVRYPVGNWGANGQNRLPPGVRPPGSGSSGSIP